MQTPRTAERRSWWMDGGPLQSVIVWTGWLVAAATLTVRTQNPDSWGLAGPQTHRSP